MSCSFAETSILIIANKFQPIIVSMGAVYALCVNCVQLICCSHQHMGRSLCLMGSFSWQRKMNVHTKKWSLISRSAQFQTQRRYIYNCSKETDCIFIYCLASARLRRLIFIGHLTRCFYLSSHFINIKFSFFIMTWCFKVKSGGTGPVEPVCCWEHDRSTNFKLTMSRMKQISGTTCFFNHLLKFVCVNTSYSINVFQIVEWSISRYWHINWWYILVQRFNWRQ